MPLISVLIANFNNGRYIEEAIKSVVKQTYSNWEIIIVDDASTDNSWDIIQSLGNKYSNIYFYRNERNLKVGATKAKSTNLARGKICAILDPDDVLDSTALEKQVNMHLIYPDCSMVSSKYYVCDEKLNVKGINTDVYAPNMYDSYLSSKGGINAFWSFKKDKYQLTEGFKSKFILAEDQDLYYQLEEVGDIKVINEPLYYYRIHEKSISKNDNLAMAYAYHLFAMFDAKKRRKKSKTESSAIKFSLLHFMTWGIMKIEKLLRLKLFINILVNFPELLFTKSVMSAAFGLFKK